MSENKVLPYQAGMVMLVVLVVLALLSASAMYMLRAARSGETSVDLYVRDSIAREASESLLSGMLREVSGAIRAGGSEHGMLTEVLSGNEYSVRCLQSYSHGFISPQASGIDVDPPCRTVSFTRDQENNIASFDTAATHWQDAMASTGAVGIIRQRPGLDENTEAGWRVFEFVVLGYAGEVKRVHMQRISVYMPFEGEGPVFIESGGEQLMVENRRTSERHPGSVLQMQEWRRLY